MQQKANATVDVRSGISKTRYSSRGSAR